MLEQRFLLQQYKAKTAFTKSKDSILKTIDTNGNGEVDIEDFIIIGLKKLPQLKSTGKIFYSGN